MSLLSPSAREHILSVLILIVLAIGTSFLLIFIPYKTENGSFNYDTGVAFQLWDIFNTFLVFSLLQAFLWGFKNAWPVALSSSIAFFACCGVLISFRALGKWCDWGNDALVGMAINLITWVFVYGSAWIVLHVIMKPKKTKAFALLLVSNVVTSLFATAYFGLFTFYRSTVAFMWIIRLVIIPIMGGIGTQILQRASTVLSPIKKGTEVLYYMDFTVFLFFVNRFLLYSADSIGNAAGMAIVSGLTEFVMRISHKQRWRLVDKIFHCCHKPSPEEEERIKVIRHLSYEDRLKTTSIVEYVSLIVQPFLLIGGNTVACPYILFDLNGRKCDRDFQTQASMLAISALIQVSVQIITDILCNRVEIKSNIKIFHSWDRHRRVDKDGPIVKQSDLNPTVALSFLAVNIVTTMVRLWMYFYQINSEYKEIAGLSPCKIGPEHVGGNLQTFEAFAALALPNFLIPIIWGLISWWLYSGQQLQYDIAEDSLPPVTAVELN